MAETATTNHRGNSPRKGIDMLDFSAIVPGTLPAGTKTPQGVIERSSLTAYEMSDGTWVPFAKVHGPAPWAEPLVALG
jgi:hypothetical protein